MPQFAPGEARIAIAPIRVAPSGLSCQAEIFLGPDELTKVATSDSIPFTSIGVSQDVRLPITMPDAEGTYHVFIDIYAERLLIAAYEAIEDVVITVPVAMVEILRPNAPGDVTALIPVGDTPNWKCVDEATPDEDTTYVKGSNPAFRGDLYNLPASSGSGIINFIKIYYRCKKGPTDPARAYASLKSDAQVKHSSQPLLTTSWVNYSYQWDTNPAGLPWTWAEIDALQIGINLHAAYPGAQAMGYCTQVYVEVGYTP